MVYDQGELFTLNRKSLKALRSFTSAGRVLHHKDAPCSKGERSRLRDALYSF